MNIHDSSTVFCCILDAANQSNQSDGPKHKIYMDDALARISELNKIHSTSQMDVFLYNKKLMLLEYVLFSVTRSI